MCHCPRDGGVCRRRAHTEAKSSRPCRSRRVGRAPSTHLAIVEVAHLRIVEVCNLARHGEGAGWGPRRPRRGSHWNFTVGAPAWHSPRTRRAHDGHGHSNDRQNAAAAASTHPNKESCRCVSPTTHSKPPTHRSCSATTATPSSATPARCVGCTRSCGWWCSRVRAAAHSVFSCPVPPLDLSYSSFSPANRAPEAQNTTVDRTGHNMSTDESALDRFWCVSHGALSGRSSGTHPSAAVCSCHFPVKCSQCKGVVGRTYVSFRSGFDSTNMQCVALLCLCALLRRAASS